jgi:DNA polymerase III sliding clamp (beta) subunit (PCNA family)
MKLKIETKLLKKSVKNAYSGRTKKYFPLVTLEASNNCLNLIYGNLDFLGIEKLDCECEKGGQVVVNIENLQSLLKVTKEKTIIIESEGDLLKIDSRQLQIQYHEYESFIKTKEKRDINYDQKLCEISAENFCKNLSRAKISTSNDPARYHLSGVFFECLENQAKFVATDGHTLILIENQGFYKNYNKSSFTISKDFIDRISNIFLKEDTIEIYFKEKILFLKGAKAEFYIQTINAEFPDYRRVLPQNNNLETIISKKILTEELKLASVINKLDKHHRTKLIFSKNNLKIESLNCDEKYVFIADIKIDCNFEMAIGFNSNLLTNLINESTEDSLTFFFRDELSPCLIKDNNDYLAVIMPVRV